MTDETTPPDEPTPADEISPPTTTEEGLAGEAAPATEEMPSSMPDPHGWFRGTGRRKKSVARVRLCPGEGTFLINGRPVEVYFTELAYQNAMWAPLEATQTRGQLDVYAIVRGGGMTGQAGALRLGLGRALRNYDPSLENVLRDNGFLTVDARQVERKKYGRRKARRSFQFSKR